MRVTVTELKKMIAESVAKNITKEQVAAASAPPARAPMAPGAARGAAPSQSAPLDLDRVSGTTDQSWLFRDRTPATGAAQAPEVSAFITRTAAVIRDLTSRGRPGSPGSATRSQLSLARRVINQTPDYATNRQAQAQAQSYLDAAKASITRGIQQANQKISEIDRFMAQSSDARRMSGAYERQGTGIASRGGITPDQSATMANALNTQQRRQLETIKQMLQTQILPVYQNLQATISPLNATSGGRVLSAINNPRTGTQLLQNMENQLTQSPLAALLGLRAAGGGAGSIESQLPGGSLTTEGAADAPADKIHAAAERAPDTVGAPLASRPRSGGMPPAPASSAPATRSSATTVRELRSMVREVIEEMMGHEEKKELDEVEELKEAVRKVVRAELKRSAR